MRIALPAALAGTIAGILAGDARLTPWAVGAAGGALLAAVGLGALRRGSASAALLALAVGLAVGAWRAPAAAPASGPGSIAALIGEERQVAGTIAEDPVPGGDWQRLVLDEIAVGPPDARAVSGRIQVRLPRALPLTVGDRVLVRGAIEAPPVLEDFDYRAYLARHGVVAVLLSREARIVAHRAGPLEPIAGLRAWLLGGLLGRVPEPEAALGAGILLGVRSGIAPGVESDFATAGLTHVVAISGWNIAIVAAIAAAATRPLARGPGGRWLASATAVLTVAGYVLLTGASPSVVRAALMAGALLVARLGGSPAHALSALMATALVMVLVTPAVLWDVGFQLSALATGGLIAYATPIQARLAGWPAFIREPMALTLAAQLTTLPVVLSAFDRLSLVAPLANVAVVPLVPAVMLACALAAPVGALTAALPLGIIGDVAGWAAGGTAWLLLRLMIVAGHAAASVPMASVGLSAPWWLAAAWYPGLGLIGWWRARSSSEPADEDGVGLAATRVSAAHRATWRSRLGWMRRPSVLVAALALSLAALTAAGLPDGRLHLVMLDIGQGDAILIETGAGTTVLVDGGPDPDLLLQRLGEELPFWRRQIDLLILTHPHQDHVGGLPAVLERFAVRGVIDAGRGYDNPAYARFLALAADEAGAELRLAEAGTRLALDSATELQILFPSAADRAAPLPDGDVNNASVVALLRVGAFSALLTGDAEAPIEALLLARGQVGPVTVLKVGHHGSESSTTPTFLAAVKPRLALISAGAGNEYGHPRASTLEHLAAVPGLRVLRTDLAGSIEIVSDGRSYVLRGETGSIGPWPFPPPSTPSGSSRATTCRRGWSSTRAASRACRPRRPACWRRAASRSTRSWPPPRACCTTSTSSRRGAL